MFKELTQIYKIGKDLGLKKSEINRMVLFSGEISLLVKILLIIVGVLVTAVIVAAIVIASRNIYPSGTLYSSVKINDFRNRK
ncbi:MAG: hypothetical protein V3V33_07250 [Candidatus Lokiarchaeia archaeon]